MDWSAKHKMKHIRQCRREINTQDLAALSVTQLDMYDKSLNEHCDMFSCYYSVISDSVKKYFPHCL